MKSSSPFSWFGFALLILLAPSPTWAQDGLRGAVSNRESSRLLPGLSFGQRIVAADFDNDRKPDAAVLTETRASNGRREFRIELHVSAETDTELTFSSSDSALSLSAPDVNQDGAPDIVVEQTFTHRRTQVWLNDGHGSFHEARPEDFPPAPETPLQLDAQAPGSLWVSFWLPSKLWTGMLRLRVDRLKSPDSSQNPVFRSDFELVDPGYPNFFYRRGPPSPARL